MKLLERFRRSDSGQAIVEVAVVTPFLFILLVSVIDIGRVYHYREIVGNSARAAVQYGAQGLTFAVDDPGMSTAGQNDGEDWLTGTPQAGLTVTGTEACYCSNGSLATCLPPSICPPNTHMLTYAVATSTYQFSTLFNYRIIPHTFPISRTEQLEVGQ
jgi:Flp pilus assembly pilin Flp